MKSLRAITLLFCMTSTAILGGCGGNSSSGAFIGGTVAGIPTGASVILQNNGVNNTAVSVNGAFTFATKVSNGSAYNVTVGLNPVAASCLVTNASGTATDTNVTNVAVNCIPNVTLGGSISGLTNGNVLILQNGNDAIASASNGLFVFNTTVPIGANYNVVVVTTPSVQNCTVLNGTGTIAAGSSNITNVQITCI